MATQERELCVSEVLAAIDREWSRLMTAIDAVPEHRASEPGVCGEWSVKDLLGHIAFWDEQVLEDIRRFNEELPALENDWQAINEREFAARRDRTYAEQRAELERCHRAVVETVSQQSKIDPDVVGVDTWEHYTEHAAEIQAWREHNGV